MLDETIISYNLKENRVTVKEVSSGIYEFNSYINNELTNTICLTDSMLNRFRIALTNELMKKLQNSVTR